MFENYRIDGTRLWTDLMALGKIGLTEGKGVTRTALSPLDIQARKWLLHRMEIAGLEVREDQAGNMVGTLKTVKSQSTKVAAVGSHLDTVPQGGMFDGALGVLAALECARTIRENSINLPWDLEIINFCDEEGKHYAGTMGSRAMLGNLSDEDLNGIKKKGDKSFADSLAELGKDPGKIKLHPRPSEDFAFFLELHIEQGKILETKQIDIGAVTGIAGIYRFTVTVKGEAGHAGTFPMNLRDDALVKAAPLFTLLPQWVIEKNPQMVGTIGKVDVMPGAPNVIPETCSFVVELRSQEEEDIGYIVDLFKSYTAQHQGFEIMPLYEKPPRLLNETIITTIEKAAKHEGCSNIRIISGAGHDAHTFAAVVPTGVIFIPCRNGASHTGDEWVEKKNAISGCQVLLRTILDLSKEMS